MSEWHPIDTAPPARRKPILLWNGIEVSEGFYYRGGPGRPADARWVALAYFMGIYRYPPATHWMEMPEPPRR